MHDTEQVMKAKTISGPFITTSNGVEPSLVRRLAFRFYESGIKTQDVPCTRRNGDTIKIVCIADTHNCKPPLPPGDLLLHAGDLSQYGTFAEIQAQLDWINIQPHNHKIVVAGNHDLILDNIFVTSHPDRELNKPGESRQDLNWGDIIYLQDSEVTVQSRGQQIRIYGSPYTPYCGTFAFQYDRQDNTWAKAVPGEVDILLTHGPPAAHLDGGKGCGHLLQEIWRARPKYVFFGHIHHAKGHETVELSPVQAAYEEVMLKNWPWIKLLKMVLLVWLRTLIRFVLRNQTPFHRIHYINAAVRDDDEVETVQYLDGLTSVEEGRARS